MSQCALKRGGYSNQSYLKLVVIRPRYSMAALEKAIVSVQNQHDLFHSTIDFKKAFDRVWRAGLVQVPTDCNIEKRLVEAS